MLFGTTLVAASLAWSPAFAQAPQAQPKPPTKEELEAKQKQKQQQQQQQQKPAQPPQQQRAQQPPPPPKAPPQQARPAEPPVQQRPRDRAAPPSQRAEPQGRPPDRPDREPQRPQRRETIPAQAPTPPPQRPEPRRLEATPRQTPPAIQQLTSIPPARNAAPAAESTQQRQANPTGTGTPAAAPILPKQPATQAAPAAGAPRAPAPVTPATPPAAPATPASGTPPSGTAAKGSSALPAAAAGAAVGAAAVGAAAASSSASPAPTQAAPGAPGAATAGGRQAGGPKRIDEVRQGRVQSTGAQGQTVIQELGNRTIIKQDNHTIVTRNETTVINNFAPGARSTQRPGGITETVYDRPGGVRVFSEVDGSGRLVRRYRRDSGGGEVTLVDNRRFYRNIAIGVGAGLVLGAAIVALAPPAHAVPRHRYIVDYDRASDDDLYEALSAPPVERLDRVYSLDEIRYSEPLRARMRRIDLDGINFELGSFDVTPDQYGKLQRIARAILRAVERNPSEMFMIEGHTDATGEEEDNLSLSDRRAEAVAFALVERFGIPLENLVTQGYGEQYLKVETSGPERLNRRVAVRRITPLLSQQGPN